MTCRSGFGSQLRPNSFEMSSQIFFCRIKSLLLTLSIHIDMDDCRKVVILGLDEAFYEQNGHKSGCM